MKMLAHKSAVQLNKSTFTMMTLVIIFSAIDSDICQYIAFYLPFVVSLKSSESRKYE